MQKTLNITPNFEEVFLLWARKKAIAVFSWQLHFWVLAKRWMRSMILAFRVEKLRSDDLLALSSQRRDENCDRIHASKRILWTSIQRRLFTRQHYRIWKKIFLFSEHISYFLTLDYVVKRFLGLKSRLYVKL